MLLPSWEIYICTYFPALQVDYPFTLRDTPDQTNNQANNNKHSHTKNKTNKTILLLKKLSMNEILDIN